MQLNQPEHSVGFPISDLNISCIYESCLQLFKNCTFMVEFDLLLFVE
jgi:hypothetical protein